MNMAPMARNVIILSGEHAEGDPRRVSSARRPDAVSGRRAGGPVAAGIARMAARNGWRFVRGDEYDDNGDNSRRGAR